MNDDDYAPPVCTVNGHFMLLIHVSLIALVT